MPGPLRLVVIAVGMCAALWTAAVANATVGDVYVVDSANNTIYRIDHLSGGRSTVASGSPINGPRGLAFGPDGQLYVANINGPGTIVRVNPATGAKTTVASGAPMVNPRGTAFDSTGRLLVGDNGTFDGCTGGPLDGLVVAVNVATGSKAALTTGGMTETNGVDVFPTGGIVASDCGASGSGGPADGRIVRVNPTTGAQTPLAFGSLLFNPNAVAAGLDGVTYVSDFGPTEAGGTPLDGRIVRVSASGAQSLLASGVNLDNPQTDIFDFSGSLLVADIGNDSTAGPNDGKIVRVTRSGAQSLFETGLKNPRGLTIEPPKCAGKFATIVGTTGRDVITGSPSRDVIAGLGGKDKLKGVGGKDLICGNGGRDKLIGKGGKDRLIGQGGKDKLLGGRGRDKLKGGKGRDTLRGQGGRDVLAGGRGRDRLIGGGGRDRLIGGPGLDIEIQ